MFSIIIPTFNNLKYLKLCIKSIKKTLNLIMKLLFTLMKVSTVLWNISKIKNLLLHTAKKTPVYVLGLIKQQL